MKLITAKSNVIQMFEFRKISKLVIIMAYCPLESMIDASIVSENEYVTAWGQILDDLSHLHTKKMVHRDLKPENFLIEMNSLCKVLIADFGMAKVATDIILLRTFCGSPKYTALEVFLGFGSGYGAPADI